MAWQARLPYLFIYCNKKINFEHSEWYFTTRIKGKKRAVGLPCSNKKYFKSIYSNIISNNNGDSTKNNELVWRYQTGLAKESGEGDWPSEEIDGCLGITQTKSSRLRVLCGV